MTEQRTCWIELGIEPTTDPKTIKHAYAAKLKQIKSSADREPFLHLRKAYEKALAYRETSVVFQINRQISETFDEEEPEDQLSTDDVVFENQNFSNLQAAETEQPEENETTLTKENAFFRSKLRGGYHQKFESTEEADSNDPFDFAMRIFDRELKPLMAKKDLLLDADKIYQEQLEYRSEISRKIYEFNMAIKSNETKKIEAACENLRKFIDSVKESL